MQSLFLWLFVFFCKKKKENVKCVFVVDHLSQPLVIFFRTLNYFQKMDAGASFMNKIFDAKIR